MRYLVVRIGAFGDCIIITPLLRYLKQQGHEVYVLTSDQGLQMLANNPNIDKTIHHKQDSVENEKLTEYFESLKEEHKCDELIDLCESVEVTLALDGKDPLYKMPKYVRREKCNANYYEYTFAYAQDKNDLGVTKEHFTNTFCRGELFFSEEEENNMKDFRKKHLGFQMILWGLSGSGRNKCYPYVPYIVGDIMRNFPKVKVVLVGDRTCQLLECGFPKHHRIIRKCGEWSMRESALYTKYADLVVSPDTGLLHAAGCFSTPKIGLLGATTIENITKHFENDNSIEANCDCAQCFKIIQQAQTECPIDPLTNACYCMSTYGITPEVVYDRIEGVLNGSPRGRRYNMPSM